MKIKTLLTLLLCILLTGTVAYADPKTGRDQHDDPGHRREECYYQKPAR